MKFFFGFFFGVLIYKMLCGEVRNVELGRMMLWKTK